MADHYIVETALNERVISPIFPKSFKMAVWPNALGSLPADSVGKPVRVTSALEPPARNGEAEFVIISADRDGTLHLGYVDPQDA